MAHVTEARRWKLVALASMSLLIGYIAGQLSLSATAQASANERWEFAEVEYIEGAGVQAFLIYTPDETHAVAGAMPVRDELIETLGLVDVNSLPPMLLILNKLGDNGWEFAGMSRMSEDAGGSAFKYLLKRRRG